MFQIIKIFANLISFLFLTVYITIFTLFSSYYIEIYSRSIKPEAEYLDLAKQTVEIIRAEDNLNNLSSKLGELNLEGKRYTSNEVDHLIDVKSVLNKLELLAFVTILLLVTEIIYFKQKERVKDLIKIVLNSIKLNIAIVIVLSTFVFIFWQISFTKFHEILFPHGNWSFPADSLLITLFPEQFWFNSAIIFVLLILLLNFGILVFTKYFLQVKIK